MISFRQWSGGPGFNPRSSYTKDLKKWYLMPPCLTLSIMRCGWRVKWSNSRNGVAPYPTPRCGSYWKGNLQVTLNYKTVGLMSRVFANGLGDRGSIPCRVIPKIQKWYLMPPTLLLLYKTVKFKTIQLQKKLKMALIH